MGWIKERDSFNYQDSGNHKLNRRILNSRDLTYTDNTLELRVRELEAKVEKMISMLEAKQAK